MFAVLTLVSMEAYVYRMVILSPVSVSMDSQGQIVKQVSVMLLMYILFIPIDNAFISIKCDAVLCVPFYISKTYIISHKVK